MYVFIIPSRFPSLRSYLPMQQFLPPVPRFFLPRIKRFIAFLALLLYVCTNDWACLVYLPEASPRRKSLFIKKGLAGQVVGFVTVKTVENLYTGCMANIQTTSFGFILMPSAIISRIIRGCYSWKNFIRSAFVSKRFDIIKRLAKINIYHCNLFLQFKIQNKYSCICFLSQMIYNDAVRGSVQFI